MKGSFQGRREGFTSGFEGRERRGEERRRRVPGTRVCEGGFVRPDLRGDEEAPSFLKPLLLPPKLSSLKTPLPCSPFEALSLKKPFETETPSSARPPPPDSPYVGQTKISLFSCISWRRKRGRGLCECLIQHLVSSCWTLCTFWSCSETFLNPGLGSERTCDRFPDLIASQPGHHAVLPKAWMSVLVTLPVLKLPQTALVVVARSAL